MHSFKVQPESANNCRKEPENRGFLGERFYTRKEVCAELRIASRTFTRLRSAGEGPSVTWVGGRQLFTASEIRRWLKDQTEAAGKPYEVRGNRV